MLGRPLAFQAYHHAFLEALLPRRGHATFDIKKYQI
jgi:hypothetical protein